MLGKRLLNAGQMQAKLATARCQEEHNGLFSEDQAVSHNKLVVGLQRIKADVPVMLIKWHSEKTAKQLVVLVVEEVSQAEN